MPEVEPITREEKLWSGEDIEPITREEQYIKHIYDKTQKIPSKPITRKEMLLEKAGDGGGSDVTIKQLSVTANGTYSEENTAYSPVIVNVPAPPIPDNAYLLNEVEGLPSDIATFTDGSTHPMSKLEIGIEPQQDLHGYDHPWAGGVGKNKFETTGTTATNNGKTFTIKSDGSVSITGVADSNRAYIKLGQVVLNAGTYILSSGSTSNNYFIDFTFSVSGNQKVLINELSITISQAEIVTAWLNAESVSTPNNVMIYPMIRTSGDSTWEPYSNICPISGWDEVNLTVADDVENPTVSNVYTIDLDGTRYGVDLDVINGISREYKEYPSYNGETLIGPWISDRDAYAEGTTPTIGAQVVDKGDISTFNTIPTAVKSLRGVNNVYADTGDIEELEYFSKEA
jgi:hypothetical protein